jgi:hypothetical protein
MSGLLCVSWLHQIPSNESTELVQNTNEEMYAPFNPVCSIASFRALQTKQPHETKRGSHRFLLGRPRSYKKFYVSTRTGGTMSDDEPYTSCTVYAISIQEGTSEFELS